MTDLVPRLKIEMKNAPSFLGYSQLSAEVTAGAVDHREQIDLSTDHPLPAPDAPRYYNLLAPNQWPSPEVLPNFRPVFTEYMKRMGDISIYFTSLIAEAIELPSDAFNKYFDRDQQHKLKIVKYPDVGVLGAEGKGGNQGVGPHKDSSEFSRRLFIHVTPFPLPPFHHPLPNPTSHPQTSPFKVRSS
jgi:isopenicillin N synthase-like dioxygenase